MNTFFVYFLGNSNEKISNASITSFDNACVLKVEQPENIVCQTLQSTFGKSARGIDWSKEVSNPRSSETLYNQTCTNISKNQDGIKLEEDAFKRAPTGKESSLKEHETSNKTNRDGYKSTHAAFKTALNPRDNPSEHKIILPQYKAVAKSIISNKMESTDVTETNKEESKLLDENPTNASGNFDGKGPIGFDAAFEQICQSGVGPRPMRFGQAPGMPPRFNGIGGFNPRFQGPRLSGFGNPNMPPIISRGFNANLEPIADRRAPTAPEGAEVLNEMGNTLTHDKETCNDLGDKTDQPLSEKKPGALPSLLDIQVKLPPPANNINIPSNLPENTNLQKLPHESNQDEMNSTEGAQINKNKDFTPTLRTSVTFANGPTHGPPNSGLLNKPYGFEKRLPNALQRQQHPPWFRPPNLIRPARPPNMSATYNYQGHRFNGPPGYAAASQGYGNFQPHPSPLHPVIYNESDSMPIGIENSAGNSSLPYAQTNDLKRSFESGTSEENGAPSKRMLHDGSLNSNPKDVNAMYTNQGILNKEPVTATKDDKSVYERVRKVVTPLWNMPITVQLEKKNGACNEFLGHLKNGLVSANQALNIWFQHQEGKSKNGIYLESKEILASPVTNGYRNKCDFVIGINPETKLTTVGFLIEQGTSFVGPLGHLSHISEGMKYVALELEKYCQASEISPFDLGSGNGHWMGATIRQSKFGEIMLNVAFHPQELNKLQIKSVKEKLRAYFITGPGQVCSISSLFFTTRKQWESGETENIYGTPTITEEVCGKRFQVSSRSFFAVNTSAAELMYNTISEMVHLNLGCTLVDICCGTGSIGLSLSDRCGQVLGIDILEDAINDANKNALANNITNCEFMTGSVEEHLPNLWRRVTFSEAICVIDPPRAGIGSKAIQSIRKYASVTKVIYVASDPQSAVKNFLDFVRPPSNIFKGDPFVPVKAAPVDLFPHTSNFCIVFLFMRVKMADLISPENVNVESYLRGAGEKQNSRGASRGLTNNTNPYRNSNTFPEHSVNAGPAPDLTWKKVQASSNNTIQSNQQSRESLSSELSEEQIDWLDQMVQLYGSAFQRDQWIESFKAQNAEASANYLAGIEQSQTYPTAQESLKKTEQNNPANSAATAPSKTPDAGKRTKRLAN